MNGSKVVYIQKFLTLRIVPFKCLVFDIQPLRKFRIELIEVTYCFQATFFDILHPYYRNVTTHFPKLLQLLH